MTEEIDLNTLRDIPLFSEMDEQEISAVRAIMDVHTHRAGDVIIRDGEIGDRFYVLVKGQAHALIQDASGREIVLDELEYGACFGELSMLTGEPRLARIKAVSDVMTLGLERHEFFDFLRTHPNAALDVMVQLGKRLRRMDALLRQSVSRNVNQVDEDRMTIGQRIADTVAETMGSWRFIIVQSSLLLTWIMLNVTAWIQHWDPYPFILLNLALSFQAAYAAPFIMMSQNRQASKDRLAAEIDHQVNAKAELEIGLLMQRVDDLERILHEDHTEHIKLLETLKTKSVSG